MNIREAREIFAAGGASAPALVEAARQYMDAHDYGLAEPEFWEQAELVLSAISGGQDALIAQALRLWQSSPGASRRISHGKLSVTDAAKAARVTRAYIKAEIAAGRLAAAKNATGDYEITMAAFRRWMDNPRRGSRSK